MAALCTDQDPVAIAEKIGDGGAGQLKKLVTESVNEYFAPIRARRAELVADHGYLEKILADGNEVANEVGNKTLNEVRSAMQMIYY